jgi:peptidoglycan/xylan/chitin deacetylase (PgdA/CDA1 family)
VTRSIVCLTFDHDNASAGIARGMTTPTAVSRGDFGMVAVPRILSLLAAHDIRSTWFIPGHTIASYPACVTKVAEGGHEIAHHGWTHRTPASLGREGEERELVRGNKAIRALTGHSAKGYRSPAWDLSPHTVDLLLAYDFEYDSSMMGDDYLPYQATRGDIVTLEEPLVRGSPTELVEMPVSWSLDDFPVFEYMRFDTGIQPGLMNVELVLQNWLADYAYMRTQLEWGIITYTFHPHVIGRGHRMLMLEKLIGALRDDGAEFLTMMEAVGEYRRRYSGGRAMGSPSLLRGDQR